jgi:uncharacterized membrane protein YciS (DUF1049 family)
MNETIYLKHPWKVQELIIGVKYHFKNSRAQKISNTIYLIVAIYYMLIGLYGLLFHSDPSSVSSIIWGLFFILLSRLNMILFTRNIKRLNYENKEIEWEISRDRVIYRIINVVETKYNWESIQGILDTPKGFLLYPQKNTFHWLPKEVFVKEEDIALFAFIAQNNVKNFQHTK